MNIFEKAVKKFAVKLRDASLVDERVEVKVSTLSPLEAIGRTSRNDFALLRGKEVMIEASFLGSYGQAFTTAPQHYSGRVGDVLNHGMDSIEKRAIVVSVMNAVCRYLGLCDRTRHCKDRQPDECGGIISHAVYEKFGRVKVGLIGYQPAILRNLVDKFGLSNVLCSDLNEANVGHEKFGVRIFDGRKDNGLVVRLCDLILVTSSSIVNGTFDRIYSDGISNRKKVIVFGVTGAAVCLLTGIERFCPCSA